jgi:hypothetical protein
MDPLLGMPKPGCIPDGLADYSRNKQKNIFTALGATLTTHGALLGRELAVLRIASALRLYLPQRGGPKSIVLSIRQAEHQAEVDSQ